MATFSTNTTFGMTTNAQFQAWCTEILNALVTQLGVTQTADSGQINPATVTIPATTVTSAGYAILAFNDTLQATAPIVFKLEFGTGNTVAIPMMWITVGTGSNGSGTINGTVTTRVQIGNNTTVGSTVTNYVSRFVYNTTQGVCGMVFKISGTSLATTLIASIGFYIYRSVNSLGVATSDSTNILTNAQSATGGSSGSTGISQGISYNIGGTVLAPTAGVYMWAPISGSATLEGTNAQVFPVAQWAPGATTPPYGITNALAGAVLAEANLNSTLTTTILGTTSLTYISTAAGPCVAQTLGVYTINTWTILMLWQ